MKRMVDAHCATCAQDFLNLVMEENEERACVTCGSTLEQIWWKRPRGPAQWGDHLAVMVHRNQETGEISYPGHHNARLRPNHERVYLRSLADVNKFERDHKVINHVMHYDSNGRAIDDKFRDQRLTS